jgi:hypothetical protein
MKSIQSTLNYSIFFSTWKKNVRKKMIALYNLKKSLKNQKKHNDCSYDDITLIELFLNKICHF